MNQPTHAPFERVRRTVEFAANVAIIAVAVLGCAVLVKQLRATSAGPSTQAAASRAMAGSPVPPVGAVLTVPGVDLASADRTLVVVLSTKCHFCADSGPFYRRLAEETARTSTRTRLVAVLPQPRDPAISFLRGLGVGVADVVQAPLSSVGARGTPTLILVNKGGVVLRTWVGQLAPEKETEVLAAVGPVSNRGTSGNALACS